LPKIIVAPCLPTAHGLRHQVRVGSAGATVWHVNVD
jgi:hypothetical protein